MSEQLSIIDLITNASLLVQLVMLILLLMSIYSWTIIFAKKKSLSQVKEDISDFNSVFKSTASIDNLYQTFKNNNPHTIIGKILMSGFEEFNAVLDSKNSVARAGQKMQAVVENELDNVSKRLSTLAMVGSISPFIGLFGTVWGIMHSFIGLTAVKQASIAVVAPGIAEALIATAMGLLVAIPATMAYNSFMTKMDSIYQQHQYLINEIHISFQRK